MLFGTMDAEDATLINEIDKTNKIATEQTANYTACYKKSIKVPKRNNRIYRKIRKKH